jgi:hypothetical protein
MTDPGTGGPSSPPPIPGQVVDDIEALIVEVEEARPVPLSANVMLHRDEFVDKLRALQDALPEELRAARWMVRQRETYIARTNEKAREVLTKAQARSDQLISENYITTEAVEEANRLIRNAETEADRIRLEAEDYAERHLAEAEAVLAEALRYVQESRAELHQALPPPDEPPISQ